MKRTPNVQLTSMFGLCSCDIYKQQRMSLKCGNLHSMAKHFWRSTKILHSSFNRRNEERDLRNDKGLTCHSTLKACEKILQCAGFMRHSDYKSKACLIWDNITARRHTELSLQLLTPSIPSYIHLFIPIRTQIKLPRVQEINHCGKIGVVSMGLKVVKQYYTVQLAGKRKGAIHK